jgi:hypothetical protein
LGSTVYRLDYSARRGLRPIKTVIKRSEVIKHKPERPNDDLRGNENSENHDPSIAGSHRVANTGFECLAFRISP